MNGRRVRADGDEDLPIHLEPGDYGFWVRGGHWITVFQRDCLSSRRGQNKGERGNFLGFRVVLAPAAP